jgi:hypothetical protein
MIKLKDILLEGKPPSILVPRRMDDRLERMIGAYIRNGSKGGLDLQNKNLTVLPAIIKDIDVGGSFVCSDNNLTTLENCPKIVTGHFYCTDNKLTSLEGGPIEVGGTYGCSYNKLTSLKGAPKVVDGHFYCSSNKLTSLEGIPKKVTGDFYCFRGKVKFTEAQVRAVCDVKGEVYL